MSRIQTNAPNAVWGPLVGYHGCDRSVGEDVLAGKMELRPSSNEYDWLGKGVYFWVGSAHRALAWATDRARLGRSDVTNPFVIGALIYPRVSLNLTDFGASREVSVAYEHLKHVTIAAATPMPRNTISIGGIFVRRSLDCAVINMTRTIRQKNQEPIFDSVYGVFFETLRSQPLI